MIQCVQDVQNIKLDELSALIGREKLGRRSECVRCSNGNLSCKSHDVITAELTWTGSHLTMSNVHLATTWGSMKILHIQIPKLKQVLLEVLLEMF